MARKNRPLTNRGMIGYGAFLIAGGIGLYLYINHAENSGSDFRLPFLLVPVYKIFGKVGTAAIPLGIGLLGVASGSIGLIRKGKNTPPAAPQATTDATVEPRQNGPRSIPGFDPLP